MGVPENMKKEFLRWPEIKAIYLQAFDDMLAERRKRGKTDAWKTAEDVMRWWIRKSGEKQIEGQTSIFDESEDETDAE